MKICTQGGDMSNYLSSKHFPSKSAEADSQLSEALTRLLKDDFDQNSYTCLASYQRILADNQQRDLWPDTHEKLELLFKCGKATALDGPMIGIPVAIRDSDYFKKAVNLIGEQRSLIASIEWMATAWNATFADTGLWMGKTYEPINQQVVAKICEDDPEIMQRFNNESTRIGRNFFRNPPDPNAIQGIGLPALTKMWRLNDRPTSVNNAGFRGQLLPENIEKEKNIPYSKTGGDFLANFSESVVPEMSGKLVYQLNYRWQHLNPVFPMTLLVDEIVQIDRGIYLGQLVYATKNFNLGSIDLPFLPGDKQISVGPEYAPNEKKNAWQKFIARIFGNPVTETVDYGYQNNGYFLMMDPQFAKDVYADDAFPQLRPRPGESGWKELGYKTERAITRPSVGNEKMDWVAGWQQHEALNKKFTQFICEASPVSSDPDDISTLKQDNESILQMLQRYSLQISEQSKHEDKLKHFEVLHKLFRAGVAPDIRNGLFSGQGENGFNTRVNSSTSRDWYGEMESTQEFDYYHGAALNLHCGFSETFAEMHKNNLDESLIFPSVLSNYLQSADVYSPNFLDMMWRNIGKYIFPWAGKSYERISPRKLSMLLDESPDLDSRYPKRVSELRSFLASAPHYDLVKKNHKKYWSEPGKYAAHLENGSWDNGMTESDKAFWQEQANNNWVFGTNLQDKRILAMDVIMRIADMNFRSPDKDIQQLAYEGPSPFVRQGYVFLGNANQSSILNINSSETQRKTVFQFNYRYPMIGGAVPIGYCLDEIVEIADGLYLGQLIYSTAFDEPFHSSVAAEKFNYQLFGYFLLLDDDWQRHRLAISLDVGQKDAMVDQLATV